MLLKVTRSSCSGKTTLARSVADRLQQVAVHDFDKVGAPEHAHRQWRHRAAEHRVRRALEYQGWTHLIRLTGRNAKGGAAVLRPLYLLVVSESVELRVFTGGN
ncbi:hypothetical protein ACIQVL_09840 [Streptomyces sp. NPDC090499]|uniref:hypothetical protein n=1 Tax=Streptomyces sp. NPDC090499 TaxID=3365965 RepID=UPI0037FA1617